MSRQRTRRHVNRNPTEVVGAKGFRFCYSFRNSHFVKKISTRHHRRSPLIIDDGHVSSMVTVIIVILFTTFFFFTHADDVFFRYILKLTFEYFSCVPPKTIVHSKYSVKKSISTIKRYCYTLLLRIMFQVNRSEKNRSSVINV